MLWLFAVLAAFAGCARGPRLIPAKTMAKLYREFHLTDEWLLQHGKRRMADTARVYEPVLNRYGYTTDDYLYSVRHYMADPERFSKQIKAGMEQLEEERLRLTELRKQRREREEYFRHEPWEPVSFEDIDYLKRPVIPPFVPIWQRDRQPSVLKERMYDNAKNLRRTPVPVDGE